MAKISIIGATGTIGKNVAFTLACVDVVNEIVMFSRPSSKVKVEGEVLDMYDALAAKDVVCKLTPSCDFKDIANSDIVIITSGIPRKEGMNRLDLAIPNAKIVSNYSKQIAKYAPDSIILVVTNPVDVMTSVALEASGFDRSKVIGLGNHLDSFRLKIILSNIFNINSSEVHTRVVGEHGNNMVPLLSSTTIGGIPLEVFTKHGNLTLGEINQRLKNAGNLIISKKGSTEYGPAYAISDLVTNIIKDNRKVLTVSTFLKGEVENVRNICLGVPTIISKNGVEMIVPIHMNHFERKEFFKAAITIRESTKEVMDYLNE